jgi:hypothetical protein
LLPLCRPALLTLALALLTDDGASVESQSLRGPVRAEMGSDDAPSPHRPVDAAVLHGGPLESGASVGPASPARRRCLPLMALATTTRGSGALPRPVAASAWEVVGRPPTRINVRTPITGRWPAPVVPVIIAWSVELWQTAGLLQLWPALPACSLAVQHPRDLGEGPVGSRTTRTDFSLATVLGGGAAGSRVCNGERGVLSVTWVTCRGSGLVVVCTGEAEAKVPASSMAGSAA